MVGNMHKRNKINELMHISRLLARFLGPQSGARTGISIGLICGLTCHFGAQSSWAQTAAPDILGEWRMDERVHRSTRVAYHERDLRIFVLDQRDDGTYRVIATVTVEAVADREDILSRPECRGKKECTYDNASEGIGRLVGNTFYVDWIDEAWIDDVYTITGDRMTGDDGNAPLDFVHVE